MMSGLFKALTLGHSGVRIDVPRIDNIISDDPMFSACRAAEPFHVRGVVSRCKTEGGLSPLSIN